MRALRILLHSPYYSPEVTSIGKYNGEMAEWLSRRGHYVRVVTAPPHYPAWRVEPGFRRFWYSFQRSGAVGVWRCPIWVPRRPSGLRRLLYMLSFTLSGIPAMLRQALWKPDVVIAVEPTLSCALAAWLSARAAGAVAWLHVQDLEVDAAFDLGLLRGGVARSVAFWLERRLMCSFDRVSTISGAMRKRILAKRVPCDRVVLFQNWVDTATVVPVSRETRLRNELGIAPYVKVALYAGNMGAKQGLEVIVEAARLLRHRADLVFLLVGDGPMRESLVEAAAGLSNLRFLPVQPTERLCELLATGDIHLLPQRGAATDLVMPSKLGGMLASGRATVAGAAPGTEVADAVSGHGLVVEPDSPRAFAEAIALLAEDPGLAARLGVAAREYALRWLDQERILLEFEVALYTAVNAVKGAAPAT